ncbi:methyl-accepting chemotaxis protein (plasmid) [Rhizobium ruizarguesonis]|uniref:Methyl-accepting chemotaxis protein n=1 Tax=Rhizobium leguminosarum TaxID=384 RepID=A0A7M3DJ34_RHILE|nr:MULTISPECIES: HAMP domain-containing methyl-accepting chemotaxis protein [Rhizobium]TAU15537.1 methyl-accepting chemotaxis protein [Rhizobium ruizarguesonis]TAU59127.1 methyl-accepting chemotaxis protein [Rhizobium ruizarguesonis]TAV03341.1 methyl-accepting chemotaxis protein [Rhizobium ruizarguesonis]TAV22510.1 methyl-accepting chemotaxis protein [Rhizobium ruizarguesonis]TAV86485.1 methyl-accepting chemotaxis protein [Rhizobium ruizarguesonis]
MKHVSIVGKFFVIMAIFGVTALGLTFYQSRQMLAVNDSYQGLLDRDASAALRLTQSNRSLETARASISDMVMTRSKEARARAEAGLNDARENFVRFMDLAVQAVPEQGELPKLKADGFSVLTDTCGAAIAVARGATSEAELAMVQQLYLTLCQPAFAAISPRFTSVTEKLASDAEQKRADVLRVVGDTSVLSLGAAITALLAVSCFGFIAIRSWLVKPIKQMVSTMKVIAEGDLTLSVEGTIRRDEIGSMARAVQIFKDNELRTRDLEKDVEASRGASEIERARIADAERQRARDMADATAGLAEGLKQLASGNLVFRLDASFAEDFEPLRANFNAAIVQLAESLRAVSHATGSIDDGAQEIALSAQDLSRRTEHQAASLEETAASLDQITQNIASSSTRTAEARHVAVEANKSARHSGKVVSSAVAAMQRIEHSSSQISAIVGVIDEIAFQTNLLALNAGVEAARSGEAGKGFAVVAQEVRELAQRSAHAAKEIKDLILNSVDEVSSGVTLVCDTGETLKIIEEQIVLINTQLDAVTVASNEQSATLSEINRTINQLDQVTQQNAAMAEESTAASTALAAEAKRLRSIVAGFQIDIGNGISEQRTDQTNAGTASMSSPPRLMLGKGAHPVGTLR